MTYAELPKLKKNSVSTTLSSGIDASANTIPVTDLSRFYDADSNLITQGIVIGYDNSNDTYAEEITITGASGTSGAGNLTGATRGVNADGSIGAARAWDSGTNIAVMFSTGIYEQIRDNDIAIFDSLEKTNVIINPSFTINQRGYVSAATLAGGEYGHDRWKAGASGGDYTFTQSENSTTITIGTGKSLIQVVENKNVYGGTYTLSWTGTATARYGVDSATPSGSYAASPITISGQTAGTIMSIEFTDGTLTDVHLVSGSEVLPFNPRQYSDELSLCLRYAWKFGGTGSVTQLPLLGIKVAAKNLAWGIFFHQQMRTTPSLSTSSPAWASATPSGNEIAAYDYNASGYLTITGALSFLTTGGSVSGGFLQCVAGTSFSGTINDGVSLNFGSTAWILYTAEL